MRLGFAAPIPTQLPQPTPHRAFGDLKATGDGRLALRATLTRPQNTLAQIRRIGATHGRASRQPSSPPFSTEGRLLYPLLPLAARSKPGTLDERGEDRPRPGSGIR